MTATGEVETAAAELELCWPARAWLIDVGQTVLAQRGGSRDALRSLLGAAICERALRPPAGAYPSAGLRVLAREVCQRLAADQESGALQPLDHDPKLLLLCARVLSASEAVSPVLDGYARTLASVVRRRARAGDFAGERLLLADMGYLNASVRPPAWSGTVSFDDLIAAGLPRIRAVCRQIAASTGYGTAAARMAPADRAALREALPVVMLQALRQHDLVTGALLLRSLGYLGTRRDRSMSCASSFLRAQQQPDGRFGYLAMEARQAEAGFGADPVAELYLPITVSCVWALTESLSGGFRLFGPEPPA